MAAAPVPSLTSPAVVKNFSGRPLASAMAWSLVFTHQAIREIGLHFAVSACAGDLKRDRELYCFAAPGGAALEEDLCSIGPACGQDAVKAVSSDRSDVQRLGCAKGGDAKIGR